MSDPYLEQGRTNQKLETREKILSAAQAYMHEGKKHTLEDVAKRAGVSRATIYRYYSNIDVLSLEAGLDIKTKSSQAIYESLQGLDLKEQLLAVQDYYNDLALDNENAFRNYLGVVSTPDMKPGKRGARRKKTLELILKDSGLPKETADKLQDLLTVLMGLEPIIVTKDVCGLDNTQSKDLLRWGLELILKGVSQ